MSFIVSFDRVTSSTLVDLTWPYCNFLSTICKENLSTFHLICYFIVRQSAYALFSRINDYGVKLR